MDPEGRSNPLGGTTPKPEIHAESTVPRGLAQIKEVK